MKLFADVPINWEIRLLPEVFFFQEGPGVRKWQFRGKGVKLLNGSNISNGLIDLSNTSVYISEEEANGKYSHFLADDGDLVIASSGITVENFHNKIAFIKKEHLPICMNTSTIRFKSKNVEQSDLRYLRFYLRTHLFKSQLTKLITGSAQLNFGPSHLKQTQIPLPPLDNQIRIATVLSRAESLIAKRKESIRLMNELLKSIFLETFGDPVRNEKGWAKKRIDEIAEVRIGPFGSLLHAEDYVDNEIPLINPSHIINGEIVPDYTLTITPEKFNELEPYQLKINDVVVARRGEIGRCAIVRTSKPLLCGTGSMFIRISCNYSPLLLQHQIYNTSLKDYLESKAKGVTMKNLNSTTLGNLQVLYPPLPLQKKFAAIAEKVESLKSKYTNSLAELKKLYGSLSQMAFKGELDLSRVPLKPIISSQPPEFKSEVSEVKVSAEKISLETDLINFIKALPVKKFTFEEPWLYIYTSFYVAFPLPVKNFTFGELWQELEKASYEEMPEYEKIKGMIYNMLDGKHLSQSFDINRKEMVMRVNT
jgi:type I restriction enzyme S subunit